MALCCPSERRAFEMSQLQIHSAKGERIPALDFFRFFAAIAVALFHCKRSFTIPVIGLVASHAVWAVDFFFVLSGYLISDHWIQEGLAEPSLKINLAWRFYAKRILKIFPLYFLTIWLYSVSGHPLRNVWHNLLFIQNFFPFTGQFEQSWSVAVVEHFYLFFPICALFLMRRNSRWMTIGFFSSLLIFGLMLRAGLWFYFRPDQLVSLERMKAWDITNEIFYLPTWCRLDGLLIGCLLAVIKNYSARIWNYLNLKAWHFFFAALALGFAFETISYLISFQLLDAGFAFPFLRMRYGFVSLVLAYFGRGLICALALLPFLRAHSPVQKYFRFWAPYFGAISYPAYLFHTLILDNLNRWFRMTDASHLFFTGTYIILVILISAAGHMLIEKPFLRIGRRIP